MPVIYPTIQRAAGDQTPVSIPISPNARGVELVIDCDTSKQNTFTVRAEYNGELIPIGTVDSPSTEALRLVPMFRHELAGQVVQVTLSLATGGLVGMTGEPVS